MADYPELETLAKPGDDMRRKLSSLFEGMMRSLFNEDGAEFRVELVADPAVQEFVGTHASALDSAFEKVEMSEAMRRRLTRSNYIFSGMKAFHELNEAFPSLLDENGNRKSFERFLNDVQTINKTYNANYLRAEYNFIAGSAEMAARWESFMQDGDRYHLQYRTQRDDKVRPEHATLDRVTLPPSDSFWEEFYPPNGWNCRCTVVQVRKSKCPATNHDEAMRLGDEALQRDSKGIFRFNAGKEGKSVPDYNPYTIRLCRDCDVAKGKAILAKPTPDNQVCQACIRLHELAEKETGSRLERIEQTEAKDKALEWAKKHLPKVQQPNGDIAFRDIVTIDSCGDEIIVSQKFITETFSKCLGKRWAADTMELTTKVHEWLPKAVCVDPHEVGRHHAYAFRVYESEYNGIKIRFKAKETECLILYIMRIIKK